MSDAESIAEDATYEATMQAEDTETFRVMVLENLENDAYWAKEERDQFEKDTRLLEQKRDRILAQAASLQAEIQARNSAAKRRVAGLRRQYEEADKKAADIKKIITRLKAEGLTTSLIQIEVEEVFGIKRSRFYDILKTM